MELRQLRYFFPVAEEGSVTLAAERRLHTAQPSLSRQIRDLELEVGVQLLIRSPHGIELTAAGRAFLDHAQLALSQVEAAGEAARRTAHPAKASFVMGFLTGTEMDWFPEAVRLLRDELPNIDVIISSQTSPELAGALLRGKVDVAFLRPEERMPDLAWHRHGASLYFQHTLRIFFHCRSQAGLYRAQLRRSTWFSATTRQTHLRSSNSFSQGRMI
jgi:LysR family transcriptional regulator, hca operon transcriptional activator